MFRVNSEKSRTSVKYLLSIAGLGGLLYGIDFGVIAAASPYIKVLEIYSDTELSWIVGAVLFGGIVSSLTAGMLAEKFGRRLMIIASAALFLCAIPVVCLSGGSLATMMSGRVLQGMSAGYMSVVMPMYLTETLPADIRGRGTGVFQFCLGFGLVLAAAVGFLVTTTFGDDAAIAWKVNFWWTMVPVAVLFLGAFRLEESPVWLEKKLRIKNEELRIAEGNSALNLQPSTSLFSRRYVIPFLLACSVLTLNKTTGMSSITSYSVMIFDKAGFGGSLANAGDCIIKLTNLVVTVFAASLMDRKGRTVMLKIGTSGMAVGMALIGLVFLAIERFGVESNTLTGTLCLVSFFLMQVFYALGPGICVWLVLSELMPSRIRANGMAIALFLNQFVAWGLASSFLPWVNAWGWNTMFFFFAANGVLYFLVSCLIPETKGKTLDELETLFDRKIKQSNNSNNQTIFPS